MERSVPGESRAEEALTSSDQELRLLVEAIPALVWRAGPEGDIEYVNKRVLEYLGAPLDEVIGWGWMEKVHPDDVAFKVRTWLTNLESGNSHDAACRFRGADGQYRWFTVRAQPVRASDGGVLRWYGVLIDIDDRRKAEEALRESEYKLRQIFDTVPSLLWSTGPDGEPTQVNQRVLDYCGMRFEDLLHLGWTKVLHPDDVSENVNAFYNAIQTRASFQAVHRLRRADGEYRWHHSRGEPLRDRQGRVIQWYGLFVDVDEAKQAEGRLAEREAKIRRLVDSNIIGIFIWEAEGRILEANDAFLQMVGYDRNDLVSGRVRWTDLTPAEWRERDERALAERKSTGNVQPYEKEYFRKNGSRAPVLIGAADFEENGNQGVAFVLDLTERKEAERTAKLGAEALRRSEAYLGEAQSLSRTGSVAFDEKKILYWSDETYRILGFDPGEGLPSREAVAQRIHPDDRERVHEEARRAVHQKSDYKLEYKFVLPAGAIKYIEVIAHPKFSASGELVEVVSTLMDVTERKRVEQALRESQAKFRDYAESASDWLWEIDPDYKFTMLTENAFGSNAADRLGAPCWDRALDRETKPEKWRLIWATLESRKPFRDFVYCSMGGNGSPMYVKASGKPVFDPRGEFRGYRGTGADVTATVRAQEEHERLRQLESDLAHMNRLSMMGELAASLAHEIAQPIGSARNNARAALNFLDKQPADLREIKEALGCIVGDADRAGDIIDRIRDHIKKAPPRKHRFDLNEAIDEVIVLGRSAITKNGVSVQTRLTNGLAPVEGDRVQLQQVILNLILNAVEAMSSVDEGARELLISTGQSRTNGVVVVVRDSGPGIDPERIERVFDAFYTTKSSGVGMGLSICRSIIDAHGGRLWAEANEPHGAAFQFTLPSHQSSS
jgi:PAS domain S-box-containing protein